MRLQKFFVALVALALAASPAAGADRKPLVIGPTGQQQQLQSADRLVTPAGAAYVFAPGGSSGQLQYNNGGVFGGFTLANDCSLSVPNIVCTKLNGVSPGAFYAGTDAANLTGRMGSLARLPQAGGNSYAGNTSSSTGDLTYYTLPACTASNQAYHYTLGTGFSCASISGVSGGTNPFFIGTPDIASGCGSPAPSSDPVGSLYMDTCTANLYQQTQPNSVVPGNVQAAAANGDTVTLASVPTAGDKLVAFCYGTTGLANGFQTIATNPLSGSSASAVSGWLPITTSGGSTSYTPCSGASQVYLVEVSGVAVWGNSFVTAQVGNTYSPTYTTVDADVLVIGGFGGNRVSGAGVSPMTLSVLTQANAAANDGCCRTMIGGAKSFSTIGTNVAPTASGGPANATDQLIVLKPTTSGWKLVTPTWKNGGTLLTTWPASVNCSTGTLCSVDTSNNVTLTATGSVTTTGSPSSGNLAKFSGAASVTNADLTGDVTTSGGVATTIAAGAVTEAKQTLANNTTNNVSTSKHGYAPILPNDATKYLDGTGAYTVPAGGGGGGTTNNYYAGSSVFLTRFVLQANSSIANNTFAAFSWASGDVVQDDVAAWASGSPTRITVPTSYTKMRITVNPTWASNGTGARWAYVQKNADNTKIALEDNRAANSEGATGVTSGWVAVTPGDYYEVIFAQTSGGALNLTGSSTATATAARVTVEWMAPNATVNPQPGLPVISEVVTSGSQSFVTISSIPSTYRDVRVVVSGRGHQRPQP
jgi:hypothetical protein